MGRKFLRGYAKLPNPEGSGVYYIENTKTAQGYVGKADILIRRIDEHFANAANGEPKNGLQRDIETLGPDAFRVTILANCDTKADMIQLEAYWKDKLKAHKKHGGYSKA